LGGTGAVVKVLKVAPLVTIVATVATLISAMAVVAAAEENSTVYARSLGIRMLLSGTFLARTFLLFEHFFIFYASDILSNLRKPPYMEVPNVMRNCLIGETWVLDLLQKTGVSASSLREILCTDPTAAAPTFLVSAVAAAAVP